MNDSLSLFLNNRTSLKVQIVSEKFIIETIRSLFFHLSSVNYLTCDQGTFQVNEVLATHDYTPKSLRGLLSEILKSASTLYEIRLFVTRVSRSSAQSVLQEAINEYFVRPFYKQMEGIRAETIISFVFQARPFCNNMKEVLKVVNSVDPIDKVFELAKLGSPGMIKVSTRILKLFSDLCRDAITVHESNALNAPGFFIKSENGRVFVDKLPSVVPMEFAQDIANAALSLMIKVPPMNVEQPKEALQNTPQERDENFMSFKLLLPTEVPVAQTPDEDILNFRAAAWAMPKQKSHKNATVIESYDSLDKVVKEVLVRPLSGLAKDVQLRLVEFLMEDQQLMRVVDLLSALFLMKRGDLHNAYVCGDIPVHKAGILFRRFIGSVPFFEYRFTTTGVIAVTVPHRLSRLITTEHLEIYQECYQWLVRIRRIQFKFLTMNCNKAITALRLRLMQLFVALHQAAIWQLERSTFELTRKYRQSKTLNDLMQAQTEFVTVLSNLSLRPFADMRKNIDKFFNFCVDFTNRGCQMDETEIMQSEQQLDAFKTFLRGLLVKSAQKNPESFAGSVLSLTDGGLHFV